MRGLSGEEGLRGRAEESEEGVEAGVCEDGVEKEEVRGHLSSKIPMKKAACAAPLVSCSIQFALGSALSRMNANTVIRTIPRSPAAKKITDGKDVTA